MNILKSYSIVVDKVHVHVNIADVGSYTAEYHVSLPKISEATLALLDTIKDDLLKEAKISAEEIFDPIRIKSLIKDFEVKTDKIIQKRLPSISEGTKNFLTGSLVHEMLGLGTLEILIADDDLEEIVINTSKEPVWVYHKEFGWLKTNISVPSEQQIQNYASIVARRVGRQITTLSPLLDAHMISGDRANATLFPISTKGNTLSIRKFARKPWTITDFIANGTTSPQLAAFLWLSIQYELNMIVAGGTSSGKTALLNTLMPFIQPNHRIISIEDTRELQLPDFMHWVPLTTRLPNAEGKGEISMLDLMINSLRMRPDRIVVGEIRRGEQAEVLFEAMHTGHSVYATLHADTAEQVLRRMTNPPISIPDVMMEALHLVAVQYRDRRKGIRRIYQVAELIPSKKEGVGMKTNMLFKAQPTGNIVTAGESVRVFEALNMHTGMSRKEMSQDLHEKIKILDWMVKHSVNTVNDVGKIVWSVSDLFGNPVINSGNGDLITIKFTALSALAYQTANIIVNTVSARNTILNTVSITPQNGAIKGLVPVSVTSTAPPQTSISPIPFTITFAADMTGFA
ncbi:MAG: ATPase, T2SS/T4P/T4SS family, partial [Candidatus Aenigmarchaeota archaeon]|nr:ATPase, T2SS/T4P/T4SS family [Candidatus Aenigmarchaeota archaeon]